MPNTSGLILDYITKFQPATIPQISNALHLTRADVRYHLSKLQNENWVVKAGKVPVKGAGRPADSYQATPVLNRQWTIIFINSILELLAEQGVTESKLADLLSQKILKDFHPKGPPVSKLTQAVKYLENVGLTASWIAGPKGPEFDISPTSFTSDLMIEALKNRILKGL